MSNAAPSNAAPHDLDNVQLSAPRDNVMHYEVMRVTSVEDATLVASLRKRLARVHRKRSADWDGNLDRQFEQGAVWFVAYAKHIGGEIAGFVRVVDDLPGRRGPTLSLGEVRARCGDEPSVVLQLDALLPDGGVDINNLLYSPRNIDAARCVLAHAFGDALHRKAGPAVCVVAEDDDEVFRFNCDECRFVSAATVVTFPRYRYRGTERPVPWRVLLQRVEDRSSAARSLFATLSARAITSRLLTSDQQVLAEHS